MPGNDPTFSVNLYIGQSTCGKTYLARRHLSKYRRVIIHDPNSERDHGAGAVLCYDKEHLAELVSTRGPVRICWRAYEHREGYPVVDPFDAFEFANQAAWAGEGFAVFWDEVERYLPDGRLIGEYTGRMINAGRHRGCNILAATRRPARIVTDLRDAATRICVGRITGDNSISYLRQLIGADAMRAPGLKPREFLDWSADSGSVVLKKSPFD